VTLGLVHAVIVLSVRESSGCVKSSDIANSIVVGIDLIGEPHWFTRFSVLEEFVGGLDLVVGFALLVGATGVNTEQGSTIGFYE
jgi:hypothetical protein